MLILPFVLEVVAVVGLTSYLSFRNKQSAVDSFAAQLTTQVGDRIQERLQIDLKPPQLSTKINLDAVQSGSLNLENFEQIQRQFWGQMRFLESVAAVHYASEQGEFLSVSKLPNGFSLSIVKKADRGVRRNYLLDNQGNIQQLINQVPNYDPRLYPYYQAAKQSGKSGWSPVFQNVLNSKASISFTTPIYQPKGSLRGVLVAELPLKPMSQFLNQLDISRSGQAFIMERSGALIATSTLESPFRGHRGNSTNFRVLASHSQNFLTQATADYLKEFGNLTAIAQPTSFSFTENDKRNFVQVVPYQGNAGLDWLIVVVVPETDFTADIVRSNRTTVYWMIAALAGSLAFGLITIRWITKPISQLSQASRDLALDRLEDPVDETSPIIELEILAYTFNQMTAYLQESLDQVKDALQESEERFTKIFRTSPDPISLRSFPEGRYLEVNNSFVDLLEYPRDEIIGRTTEELGLWKSSSDERRHLIQTLEQTGKIQGLELQLVSRSGKQIFSLVSCELIDLDGRRCLLTVAKDINDRKQLEIALQASEAKLSDILNSSKAAICCFKIDSGDRCQYEYFLPSHESMFGFTPAEMIADPDLWLSRVHPDDYDKLFVSYHQIPKSRYLVVEYRFCRKDGQWRWIIDYMTFRRDKGDDYWLATIAAVDITDRKQLELALQQSEAKLNHVLNTVTIAICSYKLEPDGRIEYDYFSPNNERVFGYSPEELLTDTRLWFSRVHPDDRHKVVGIISPSFDNGTLTTEYRFYHKNGSLRWISDHVTFCRDVIKGGWMVTAAAMDITHSKQVEANLRYQEACLREAQQVAHIGSWKLEVDTYKLEWSEEMFCLFGIAPNQPVPCLEHIIKQMIHPDDRETFKQVFQMAIAQGISYKIDLRFLRPDGSICYTENRGKPVFSEVGEVIRFVGTTLDITHRKQIELSLQQQEDQLNQITNALPVYISYLDAEQRYQFVNQLYEDRFGHPREWFYGRPIREVLGESAYQMIQGYLEIALQGTFTTYSIEQPDQQGIVRCLEVTLVPDIAPDGSVHGCHSLVIDITDRKQAQDALSQSEARLHTAFKQLSAISPGNIYTIVQSVEGQVWFEYMNAAIDEIHEISSVEVLQDASILLRCIHPDDVAGYETAVAHSAKNLTPFDHEWRIITPAGNLKWLHGNSRPERRENGDIAWCGVVIDVTNRKQMEMTLQRQQSFLRQVLDTIPSAIFVKDREGRYLMANQAFVDIYDTTIAAVVGKKDADFNPAIGQVENFLEIDREVMQTRQPMVISPKPITTPQDKLRWHRVSLSPFIDADDQVQGVIGSAVDITDFIRLESALANVSASIDAAKKAVNLVSTENTDLSPSSEDEIQKATDS
jgi:PAS domain S-box-containing protein